MNYEMIIIDPQHILYQHGLRDFFRRLSSEPCHVYDFIMPNTLTSITFKVEEDADGNDTYDFTCILSFQKEEGEKKELGYTIYVSKGVVGSFRVHSIIDTSLYAFKAFLRLINTKSEEIIAASDDKDFTSKLVLDRMNKVLDMHIPSTAKLYIDNMYVPEDYTNGLVHFFQKYKYLYSGNECQLLNMAGMVSDDKAVIRTVLDTLLQNILDRPFFNVNFDKKDVFMRVDMIDVKVETTQIIYSYSLDFEDAGVEHKFVYPRKENNPHNIMAGLAKFIHSLFLTIMSQTDVDNLPIDHKRTILDHCTFCFEIEDDDL